MDHVILCYLRGVPLLHLVLLHQQVLCLPMQMNREDKNHHLGNYKERHIYLFDLPGVLWLLLGQEHPGVLLVHYFLWHPT